MGCDIHFVAEYKTDGGWLPCPGQEVYIAGGQLIAHVGYLPRNYRLFYALAGVRYREGFNKIYDPRGLPDDMHKATANAMDCMDFHTHSWLTLTEAKHVGLSVGDKKWVAWIDYVSTDYINLDDQRVIFAFDN